MNLRIVPTLIVMFVIAGFSNQSLAGPPDFSICDDLTGPARGLCQAGVAVGCDIDGSSNACMQIAEQYENIAGEPPPYVMSDPYPPCECWSESDLKAAFPAETGDSQCYLVGSTPNTSTHYLLWRFSWVLPMARTTSFQGLKCGFGLNAEVAWPQTVDLYQSEYESCNASLTRHIESLGLTCVIDSLPPPPDF